MLYFPIKINLNKSSFAFSLSKFFNQQNETNNEITITNFLFEINENLINK